MSRDGEARIGGIDVGGTWTVAVVVDPAGRLLGRARRATVGTDGDRIVDGAAEALRSALQDAGGGDVVAAGMGVPGQVDPVAGTVRLALNLGLDGGEVPVGALLRQRLGRPVTVENDVRAAALGAYDHLRVEMPDVRSVAYLSIGTGIAAGFVRDGEVHRGRAGMAGEIGHVVVLEDGPACRCGLRGCLEAVAAGPAIGEMWPGRDDRPAEAMLAAAADGDPSARRLVEEVVGRYVLAIQWLATAWGPDLIALGGGIGSVGEPLLGPLRERLAALAKVSELARVLVPTERIVSIPPEVPAGALGAAALAHRSIGTEIGKRIDVDSGEPSGRGE